MTRKGEMTTMKNMKKNVIGGIIAVILFGGGLFLGGNVLGSNDWTTSVISSATTTISKAGENKAKELAANTNIGEQMKQVLAPEIEAQQKELERLLEDYYQMKLNGLTDTAEYKQVEEHIAKIRQTLYTRYKQQIDAIFE